MDETMALHVNALHEKALTIDAHFDLPLDVAGRRERGQRKVIETHYYKTTMSLTGIVFQKNNCTLRLRSVCAVCRAESRHVPFNI